VLLIVGVVAGIFFVAGIGGLVETVDSGEIVVKQSWFTGKLEVWTTPGPKLQAWGKCSHYPISEQFWFSADKTQGGAVDGSIKTRFNDGGHGTISGSVRYNMPKGEAQVINIHREFRGDANNIKEQLIKTAIQNAVYASGSLVSSTQSFAEKRSELMEYIIDQTVNGRLRYHAECKKEPDPVTKIEKTVCTTNIDKDTSQPNGYARLESSSITPYGITLSNWSFNEIQYDDDVKNQIKAQQTAVAAVQTSMAEAKQAEQRTITVEQQGKAAAAKAKWDQEVISATAVTKAEQEKKVALLAKESAEYTKQKLILEGEGEAKKRELIMKADGALAQKFQRDIEVAKIWADAYAKQRPTPDVVIGTSGSGGDLGSMMMLAAAKQAGIVPTGK
jgi:hypothetical protein